MFKGMMSVTPDLLVQKTVVRDITGFFEVFAAIN